MAVRKRSELKTYFTKGKKLTEGHFGDLIDSMLSLRDDQFLGYWEEGRSYRRGDVVIHQDAIWQLTFPSDPEKKQICSENPPAPGGDWEMLKVRGDDEDWQLVEESGDMYAQNEGKVGIGTQKPKGKLDITDGEKGQFLFSPDEKEDPAFTIVNLTPKCDKNYLATGVGEENAVFVSDAPQGFVFRKGNEYGYYCSHVDVNQGELLMALLQDAAQKARLGLGTGSPAGVLHATDGQSCEWVLMPEGAGNAMFLLKEMPKPGMAGHQFLTMLKGQHAEWQTDAEGFIFSKINSNPVATKQADSAEVDETAEDFLMIVGQHADGMPAVGIGTKQPAAMLEVTDGRKGSFRFNPDDKRDPAFSIINLAPHCRENYLSTGVGAKYAVSVSDAPGGFAFKKGREWGWFTNEADINQGNMLMVVQEAEDGKPRVGIGTENPGATLEAAEEGKGRVLLMPEKTGQTLISLIQQSARSAYQYALTGIAEEWAVLSSSAPNGWVFKAGEEAGSENPETDAGQGDPLVAIRREGQMGIGTTEPLTKLDITNGSSGAIQFNLDQKPNPAMSILNLRPGSKQSYLATGVGNNRAIWVTDAPFGFAFKRGADSETTEGNVHLDVNQGDVLMGITPDGKGKVGIGMFPDGYELDANGMMRAFNLYLNSNEATATVKGEMKDVLDKLLKIRAVKFEWKEGTGCKAEGEQIGFMAHEVDEQFPQLVRTNRDGSQALAYQNMVALLLQGMKEQQAQISERDEKIADLEEKCKTQEAKIAEHEKWLKELEKRIERCEG